MTFAEIDEKYRQWLEAHPDNRKLVEWCERQNRLKSLQQRLKFDLGPVARQVVAALPDFPVGYDYLAARVTGSLCALRASVLRAVKAGAVERAGWGKFKRK